MTRPAAPIDFSVAICTLNRARLLRQAVESVFDQDYPKDHYELIIVDNGSTDETPCLIEHLAENAPISLRSLSEGRIGIAAARNRAIAEATHSYIAYLDDDEIANSDWLAQLSDTISKYGALIVGGRVEEYFENGFVPPRWYNCRYLQGFFRLDYEHRTEHLPVVKAQEDDYIGSGNCAYAKSLFDRFGNFPLQLGHTGTLPLAGAETYFNERAARHGVEIYYSDDAVVKHVIDPARVTRHNMLRKSYYMGVSDAQRSIMTNGPRGAISRAAANVREMRRFAAPILRNPRHPQTFCRICRLVYNSAVLLGIARILIETSFRRTARGESA